MAVSQNNFWGLNIYPLSDVRIEPRTAGREVRTLPLSYVVPHSICIF